MADTRPSRTYIKGSLSTIFSMSEEDKEGYELVPKDVAGLSITSRRIPANPDDTYPTALREFTIKAAQRGSYSVDFEYKNKETGDVGYTMNNIFIFKRRFLGLF